MVCRETQKKVGGYWKFYRGRGGRFLSERGCVSSPRTNSFFFFRCWRPTLISVRIMRPIAKEYRERGSGGGGGSSGVLGGALY
jgi:hypothetical protein